MVIGSFAIAALFVCAGIWFVYLGETGYSTFSLFGQSFRSSNVGISALFLGAVTVVLLLRRSLKTLDNVAGFEISSEAHAREDQPYDLNEWPNVKNLTTLGRAIKALSDNQWTILAAVEVRDGADKHSLLSQLVVLHPSDTNYRLWALEREKLVVIAKDKVYLTDDVRRLLNGKPLKALRG